MPSFKLSFWESNYCKGDQSAKFTSVVSNAKNDKHDDFRLVVFHLPHASYAHKSYWLCDRCDKDFMLKETAAVNDVKT